MRRGAVLPGVLGAVLAGSVPFLVTVKAWPEIAVPAYFMSRGGVLYDTIFFPHTPLLISVLAASGALLGFSAGLFRSLVAAAMAGTAFLAVLAVGRGSGSGQRRGISAAAAAGGAVLSILWLAYLEGLAVWPDPLLAPVVLAAGLLLERYASGGSLRSLLGSGLLLGSAILVKQTSAWIALASLVWLFHRRRGARDCASFAAAVALPYAVFVLVWALAFRTTSHVKWTLVLPLFSPMGKEIRATPTLDDVHESLAPFLVLPAVFLLARGLGSRDRSPLPYLALGAVGMAWPRAGLLHLSACSGVVSVLAARGLLSAADFFRRGRREKFPLARLAASSTGIALLVASIGVAAAGGGSVLADGWRGPVYYWDDPLTRELLPLVQSRLTPERRIFLFNVARDTLYARAGASTPDGLYVNSSFWYCLDRDRVDERVTGGLERFPGWILFRDAGPSDGELRRTALYRFLESRTVERERVGNDLAWRVVRP